MPETKETRASRRLEAIRAEWDLSGAEIARECDVKQPSIWRILNGHLLPGRDLAMKIERFYGVPMAWWGEDALDVEPEPMPAKPARYVKTSPVSPSPNGGQAA